MGYSVVNVDEIEGSGPGGRVEFVRRALGVEVNGAGNGVPPGTGSSSEPPTRAASGGSRHPRR